MKARKIVKETFSTLYFIRRVYERRNGVTNGISNFIHHAFCVGINAICEAIEFTLT